MNTRDYKMIEYMLNHSEQDNQKAFLAGWDEALKSQWISADIRPNLYDKILVLYKIGDNFCISQSTYFGFCYEWNFGGNEIIAWMPIPSLEGLFE